MKTKFLRKSGQFSIHGSEKPFQGNLSIIFRTCWVFLLLLTVPFAYAAEVEDFMPQESIFYLKLQDIDAIYGEIETSENWEKALALLTDLPNWQEIQQSITMFQGILGTDPLGVFETIGYRTALAAWTDELDSLQIGVVIHSGGNLAQLQQLTKIVEGLIGMSEENTLRVDAGVYQRVRYNVMERFDTIVKYGFVGDFLVIGANEGCFEKMLDTYRTNMPSIEQNEKFASTLKKVGSGEVIVFADVPSTLSLPIGLAEWERRGLTAFQSVFGRLNLLETGPFLQVSAQFNPDLPEGEIGMFLKQGQSLKTLNTLSSKDDLFVAVAPKIAESIWEFVPTDDNPGAVSFLEGVLNLSLENDIMTGLTGEYALSVPALSRFDPEALSGISLELDGVFELDTGDVEPGGSVIFNPSNRSKWNQVVNSLSNLHNASVSQTEYKGTTVSDVASNIYHTDVDGLFLIGFSEEHIHALIDEIKEKKKPSYLKQIPETPTVFAQLNLVPVLGSENGSPPADKLIVDAKEIPSLLAWISVKDNQALLEATLSREETGLEVLAKLVPFFIWNIKAEAE